MLNHDMIIGSGSLVEISIAHLTLELCSTSMKILVMFQHLTWIGESLAASYFILYKWALMLTLLIQFFPLLTQKRLHIRRKFLFEDGILDGNWLK